jgi:hypothetical protein
VIGGISRVVSNRIFSQTARSVPQKTSTTFGSNCPPALSLSSRRAALKSRGAR